MNVNSTVVDEESKPRNAFIRSFSAVNAFGVFVQQPDKPLGIRVAMDDFGTGYSSLGYLRDFPIDKLKIDQSFIKGLIHSQVNAVIVNTMVTMARNLNLLVVAEGVKTRRSFKYFGSAAAGWFKAIISASRSWRSVSRKCCI